MMPALSFLLGITLPSMVGWIFVRLLEGRTVRFFLAERIALSWLLGLAIFLSASFSMNVFLHMPFSFVGFFGVWFALLLLFYVAAMFWKIPVFVASARPETFGPSKRWVKVTLLLLLLWTAAKICIGVAMIAGTPPYFDDTIKNWNARGKAYFFTQTYTLTLPIDEGVNGYPPFVPLAKTWISTISGDWHEAPVNLIHTTWFLSCAVLIWAFLRRLTSSSWALFGAYVYTSLPLVFIHSIHAYADVCLSTFAFVAIAYLSLGLKERNTTFLRLSMITAGLLPFLKNEGLLLYLTTFIAVTMLAVLFDVWRRNVTLKNVFLSQIAPLAGSFLLLSLPFIVFKIMNGLAFGNAKGISGMILSWHDGVVYAMVVNTFFEGNWLLFFPILILLMIWKWRYVLRLPLWPIALFCSMLLLGQILIFLFTALATEALLQTGFSRGLVQLMPLLVVLATVLLAKVFEKPRSA